MLKQLKKVASCAIAMGCITTMCGCGTTHPDVAAASPSQSPSSKSAVPSDTSGVAPNVPDLNRQADWQIIGSSVRGLPIRQLTVGHGSRRVLFIGGIHGDEVEGALTTAKLPAAFAAAGLESKVTLAIIEDLNPDGRAAGTRENANGVDVNRNFPAMNFDTGNVLNGTEPLSQPESRTLVDAINRFDPELIMVAHSWSGRQFINFDGPARQIADQFSLASGLPVEDSNSFAPTPGSLGSYAGRDRGIPILTIETLKGSDPQAVWQRLEPAILGAMNG